MLAQHKKQTYLFVGLGFGLNILEKIIEYNAPNLSLLGLPIFILAAISMICGCVHYAKGKGYSPYWGALGLLSIIGFIVLALFPDKHKNIEMNIDNSNIHTLPALPEIVEHMVNNTPSAPGEITWTGRSVELLELVYALMTDFDSLTLETCLDWRKLNAFLIAQNRKESAVEFRKWLDAPVANVVISKAGSPITQFEGLAMRIRKSILALSAS